MHELVLQDAMCQIRHICSSCHGALLAHHARHGLSLMHLIHARYDIRIRCCSSAKQTGGAERIGATYAFTQVPTLIMQARQESSAALPSLCSVPPVHARRLWSGRAGRKGLGLPEQASACDGDRDADDAQQEQHHDDDGTEPHDELPPAQAAHGVWRARRRRAGVSQAAALWAAALAAGGHEAALALAHEDERLHLLVRSPPLADKREVDAPLSGPAPGAGDEIKHRPQRVEHALGLGAARRLGPLGVDQR
mmetsp:Transcript_65409/g.149876  ORF Transcript_65409/g.149876 Transcript_65409/m.149876 type:complete len:251 (+) Transcript_65409:80-832(+)